MSQAVLNVKIDENLKKDFDTLCKEFGMSASTAVNIFAKKVVRERRIPFEISASAEDRGIEAFYALRSEAKEKGRTNLTLDEINEEINKTRNGL